MLYVISYTLLVDLPKWRPPSLKLIFEPRKNKQ